MVARADLFASVDDHSIYVIVYMQYSLRITSFGLILALEQSLIDLVKVEGTAAPIQRFVISSMLVGDLRSTSARDSSRMQEGRSSQPGNSPSGKRSLLNLGRKGRLVCLRGLPQYLCNRMHANVVIGMPPFCLILALELSLSDLEPSS